MVAAFKSESWPASNRNGGRHQVGKGGRLQLESAPGCWRRSRLSCRSPARATSAASKRMPPPRHFPLPLIQRRCSPGCSRRAPQPDYATRKATSRALASECGLAKSRKDRRRGGGAWLSGLSDRPCPFSPKAAARAIQRDARPSEVSRAGIPQHRAEQRSSPWAMPEPFRSVHTSHGRRFWASASPHYPVMRSPGRCF